ncbi:FMRFamide receptor-like [Physella acuta]|uniref:FMRFamide receptor-like n=1 Tax=Physella acuta TaxID=109671 RepID=UPI0027DC12DA|nr:FMRFamide receptor-like [Physella acuta]
MMNNLVNVSLPDLTAIQMDTPVLYLDPRVLDYFLVFNMVVCGTIGILGICGNVINILIFYRQGYNDSVNITLTSLALSDTGALLTLQVFHVMINPWFPQTDLDINARDLVMMVSFYPHNYFIRVCGFVTAFASLERCICVVSPLRVKRIINTKTAIAINFFIFIFTALNLVPPYYIGYLDWVVFPNTNRSIVTVIYRQNPYVVFYVSYIITDLLAPYATFLIILISTSIIAVKLKNQAKWRQTMVKSATNISSKEKKTVVMLSTISIVFVVCLIPQSTILTAMSFVPDLSYGGRYFDVTTLGYCVSYLSETVLSSVNILVYLRMSQKYKEHFLLIFKLDGLS